MVLCVGEMICWLGIKYLIYLVSWLVFYWFGGVVVWFKFDISWGCNLRRIRVKGWIGDWWF